MAEQDEPETVAGVTGVQDLPAASEKPEGVTRDEWLEFREEVRAALKAGATPPPAPEPEKPQEPVTPVAPAPEAREPEPVPETPAQPPQEPAEEWGSGLFFRGRKRKAVEE